MEQWFVRKKKADFNGIGRRFQIDPLVARLIRNRDIIQTEEIEEYLKGTLDDIPDGFRMHGMRQAVDILQNKIKTRKHIRIISDYDVDGVMSNYILWKAIHDMGGDVDYAIPDRMTDGYGINEGLIHQAHADGVDTIITCDNGIAAAKEGELARRLGMTYIVTDHHQVPFYEENGIQEEILPVADAIVDPKQKNCHYGFDQLCGAGVCYQLVKCLGCPKSEQFLPFLAVATVCDVVDLTKENRIFVKEGLKRIKETGHTGLQSLIQACGLADKPISSYHLGFVIGPCINASGRLETAANVMSLFLEEDQEKALAMAQELCTLNQKRKEMTEEGVDRALNIVEEKGLDKDKILVIYLPDCHESIAGIIAGRVKDRFCHPVFVLTDGKNGVKGSGRSIEGYDMFAAMSGIQDVFTKFGGHKMAAGCSLEKERVEEFRRRINETCYLKEQDFIRKIFIDADMPIDYVSLELTEQLSLLEPFGKSNARPLFAQKNLQVEKIRILGPNRNVIKMMLKSPGGARMEGILFEREEDFLIKKGNSTSLTCTYYPSINDFRGNISLEMNIRQYFFTEKGAENESN